MIQIPSPVGIVNLPLPSARLPSQFQTQRPALIVLVVEPLAVIIQGQACGRVQTGQDASVRLTERFNVRSFPYQHAMSVSGAAKARGSRERISVPKGVHPLFHANFHHDVLRAAMISGTDDDTLFRFILVVCDRPVFLHDLADHTGDPPVSIVREHVSSLVVAELASVLHDPVNLVSTCLRPRLISKVDRADVRFIFVILLGHVVPFGAREIDHAAIIVASVVSLLGQQLFVPVKSFPGIGCPELYNVDVCAVVMHVHVITHKVCFIDFPVVPIQSGLFDGALKHARVNRGALEAVHIVIAVVFQNDGAVAKLQASARRADAGNACADYDDVRCLHFHEFRRFGRLFTPFEHTQLRNKPQGIAKFILFKLEAFFFLLFRKLGLINAVLKGFADGRQRTV